MTVRRIASLTVIALCFGALALAQPVEPPVPPPENWNPPPNWTPPAGQLVPFPQLPPTQTSSEGLDASAEAATPTFLAGALPFVPVTPCRLYDSRANAPFTGDSTFAADGQTEQLDFYATSATPYAPNGTPNGCALPPAGTAGAWALMVTYRTASAPQGVLTAFPGTLTSLPGTTTVIGYAGQFGMQSAIVPAGTDIDTTIKLFAQYAARAVVIDYYGYYGSYGPGNTLLGQFAGNFTMTGASNTASGSGSLHSNTAGYDNSASGYASLFSNTTGYVDTASGYESLYSNTTGDNNTASGYASLFFNTTGEENTAIGRTAGYSNTTGSYNTFLGVSSDAAATDLTNATAIGYAATVDASNHIRIGDAIVTEIGGQVAWSNLSDARAKSDIRDLDLGLDFVMQLHPVSFTMKQGNGRTDMGFLAQDVEAVLGDGYSVLGIGGDPDRTLSLRYTDLIAPMVKAIQEQQAQIESRDARIAKLETERAAQQRAMAALGARLAAIEARIAAN